MKHDIFTDFVCANKYIIFCYKKYTEMSIVIEGENISDDDTGKYVFVPTNK